MVGKRGKPEEEGREPYRQKKKKRKRLLSVLRGGSPFFEIPKVKRFPPLSAERHALGGEKKSRVVVLSKRWGEGGKGSVAKASAHADQGKREELRREGENTGKSPWVGLIQLRLKERIGGGGKGKPSSPGPKEKKPVSAGKRVPPHAPISPLLKGERKGVVAGGGKKGSSA